MRRLAIRPGGIGDSILGFPALEHLAKDAELEVWARSEVLPLVHFAAAHSIESTGIGLLGIKPAEPELIVRLREFDEIYTWYGSNREDFREALSALHAKVKFLTALPPDETVHAADFFARQVGAPTPAIPTLRANPKPNRLILIHPFSGSARKNWSLDNFLLLQRWLENTGRSVQFVVAPNQHMAGARTIPNLAELSNLLAGGSLYIGNDTGITHLAAASGANTLALFGPTNPEVWAPRGPRVQILSAPDIDRLSVETVLDAALARTGFEQGSA
jgi:heptosyltransferase-3